MLCLGIHAKGTCARIPMRKYSCVDMFFIFIFIFMPFILSYDDDITLGRHVLKTILCYLLPYVMML